MQSPFLTSHPIRSEMLRFILKQSRESDVQQQQRIATNGSYALKEPLPALDHTAMRYACVSESDQCWNRINDASHA